MNREQKWRGLIRLVAAITAIAVWCVSIMFSVDGFSFQLPKYVWAGYVLGLSVTVIELVFNEEGMSHNLTLIALSLSAYFYDIGTNVIGIWVAQGKPELSIGTMVFPLIVGIFLALLPEPLFAWALIGTGYKDLLTHLFALEDSTEKKPEPRHNGNGNNNNGNHGERGEDLDSERQRLSESWRKLAEEKRKMHSRN